MFSNCETGTVPKIIRRNILNRRDNNISNNLEPVSMEHTCYTNAGRKSSETNDPANIVPSKDTASTSAGAMSMSSNVHQNLLDKNSSKKAEDIKYLDKRQVEDKLEQIREYISITTSIICNMRKTDEQNDPTPDDSERLEQMVHELKDSEHKLIRILESWNQSVQIPLPDADSDLTIQVVSTTNDIVDYKDEAACLELQTPLVVEQEEVLQKQSDLDLLNKAMFPILTESSRNNPSSQVEAIQELEHRLDTWNKTQINRMNLQEHLESQVEMLGDTINHLRSDSDTRRDIMQILDQKDSSLQAEHVSLQSKLLELQTKKQQVDQLVEQLHILNGHKSDDEDVGNQVRRIVSVKDQLSKLKDMLYSIQSIEAIEKPLPSEVPSLCTPTTFMENIAPESMDATLRIRNDVRNSSGLHLVGPLQEQANLLRHTQKQVNDKATNSIDRQRSLQAELQAKKHELEELMSKRKATSNLNHDGNSEKSSLGLYNSLYNDYNHKEQYSSDEISDDEANDLDADMNLSVGSLNKNQMPQSQSHINQQHLIPERLVPQQQAGTSQQQDSWTVESRPQHQLVFDEDRRQSASTKGIFIGDPSNYCREQNGQDTSRMQRIQIQKQLELIRNVCDSMLIEHSIHPPESIEDSFNNQQPSQSIQHQQMQNRKNHTPSPLCSEPLSYNNTCGTPDNQANQINILHGDQSSQIGGMTPIITTMSGGARAKMGTGGNRGRMIGNSMLGIGGGDYAEGLQTIQGSNGYNRNMKPTSSANSDQTSTIWQQQQQWLVNNTLQSQAFIMNTLNQCCQMMWLQQREIQSLRNAVQNMQLQNQNNSSVSNNQQQRFSNLQGGSSTPYVNTSANAAFTYAIAGPSGSSLSHQQQQLPGVQCSGAQKSNPNLLEMLNPNIQGGGGFPSSFPNTMLGESLDANHAADFIGSRSSNSATVHRSNMTPMSDCLNNCSNNNLSNANMNNVMHGGNNLASNSNPQIWHERSLNNQLHQGNIRANNYWDNVRR